MFVPNAQTDELRNKRFGLLERRDNHQVVRHPIMIPDVVDGHPKKRAVAVRREDGGGFQAHVFQGQIRQFGR